jgi:hypothetical protein
VLAQILSFFLKNLPIKFNLIDKESLSSENIKGIYPVFSFKKNSKVDAIKKVKKH